MSRFILWLFLTLLTFSETALSTPYVAKTYAPKASLVSLHSMPRVQGSSKITIYEYETITQRSGTTYEYLVGVIVPAVAMLVFFVGWLFFLCFAKICCKGCCGKNVALILFVGFCSLSICGWFVGLAGNSSATAGFTAMIAGVRSVERAGRTVIDKASNATNFVDSMYNLAIGMNTSCNTDPNVVFPFDGLVTGLNQTRAAVGSASQGGIVGQVQGILGGVDSTITQVTGYLEWREKGTNIVLAILIVILIVFTTSTMLRVLDSTPESCRGVARCSSRFTSFLIFFLGIIFLLVIWIFAILLQILVVVGADICVPQVNLNVNRLVNEIMFKQGTSNVSITTLDVCQAPSFLNSTFGVLCYYQTCTGPNRLQDLVGPVTQNNNNVTGDVSAFRDQLIAAGGSLTLGCNNSINAFINKAFTITSLTSGIQDVIQCSFINPVYADLLYAGWCNGLVDGLYIIYVSLVIGSVFLMLAMSVYRIFDFGRYQEGQLPSAYYVNEGEVGKVTNRVDI